MIYCNFSKVILLKNELINWFHNELIVRLKIENNEWILKIQYFFKKKLKY